MIFADKNNIIRVILKTRYENKGGDNIKKSTIKTDTDIELYLNKIDSYVDEYISSLPDESIVYKSMGFNGLLYYIYKHCIIHVIDNDSFYNDYDLLDRIFFDIYLPLCYRFNIVPSVIGYCTFVHIDNRNISDIKQGVYRKDGSRVKPESQRTVQRWYDAIETSLLYKATNENGIGSIFALKANYNYNDQPKQVIAIENNTDDKTVDELALEYSHTEPPKQIDFNEYQDN